MPIDFLSSVKVAKMSYKIAEEIRPTIPEAAVNLLITKELKTIAEEEQ